jgi:hypothetical protein
VPTTEYRVLTVGGDLEQQLNALAKQGFQVDQMTERRVILARFTDTTESDRRVQLQRREAE